MLGLLGIGADSRDERDASFEFLRNDVGDFRSEVADDGEGPGGVGALLDEVNDFGGDKDGNQRI
ncbi:hypothetical protein D3C80_2145820 [compost metagenome]